MGAKYTVTCTYVDHCYVDYLQDHRGILVGIEGSGQTAAEIAAEAAHEALDDDDMPEGVTLAELFKAALDQLDDTARFWAVDGNGNEIDYDWKCMTCTHEGRGMTPTTCPECCSEQDESHGPHDVEIPEEQSSYWFRFEAYQDDPEPEPDQIEYHVDLRNGETRVFKGLTASPMAAGLAVAIAMSNGEPVNIDVVCWTRGAALAYGGADALESYDEDPEASVFDRITVRAESHGRIA